MLVIPGKIPYIKKANLKIKISAGTMVNQQDWVSAEKHKSYFDKKYFEPYKNISVKIFLDEDLLTEHYFSEELNFEHNFLDTDDTTEHTLKIVVSGFDPKFCQHIADIGSVSPMIKMDVLEIEDLNMKNLLEDQGQCIYNDTPDVISVPSSYMGQNGHQILKFSTPIYVWLLENETKYRYYL